MERNAEGISQSILRNIHLIQMSINPPVPRLIVISAVQYLNIPQPMFSMNTAPKLTLKTQRLRSLMLSPYKWLCSLCPTWHFWVFLWGSVGIQYWHSSRNAAQMGGVAGRSLARFKTHIDDSSLGTIEVCWKRERREIRRQISAIQTAERLKPIIFFLKTLYNIVLYKNIQFFDN